MVVDKMDKQFQSDLNTRRGANALIKRSSQMYADLTILQQYKTDIQIEKNEKISFGRISTLFFGLGAN